MIWDAIILRFRADRRRVDDLVLDDLLPLGTLEFVKSVVGAAFPDAQWVLPDCAECRLDHETTMRIDPGYVENSNTLHFAVTGPGNPLLDLLPLASANGWVVFDVASRQMIQPPGTESSGYAGYQALWARFGGGRPTGDA